MRKTIEGYNGRYEIDSNGTVYSNGKILKPYLINSGYLSVKLQNHGIRKACLIHRLVAKYFLNGSGVVDHIDGNRLNNDYRNLRYCSQKENLYYHGYDYNSGVNHYKSVLTIEDVENIRKCREVMNMRNRDIYLLYPNISHTAIDNVLNYKSYKKIPC